MKITKKLFIEKLANNTTALICSSGVNDKNANEAFIVEKLKEYEKQEQTPKLNYKQVLTSTQQRIKFDNNSYLFLDQLDEIREFYQISLKNIYLVLISKYDYNENVKSDICIYQVK